MRELIRRLIYRSADYLRSFIYPMLPLLDLNLLNPDLLLAISTEAGLLSFAMPVAGFQSANGDLKKERLDAGAAAPSVARGLLVMTGMTPPGTTPSEVCNGTGAMLCSMPKLLVAPWLFCVNSLLGLNRCLKLLSVPVGACNSPDWVRSAPLLARKGTFASKSGGPGPMPAASPTLRQRASLGFLLHIMHECLDNRILQHLHSDCATCLCGQQKNAFKTTHPTGEVLN